MPCVGSDYARIEDFCIAPDHQGRGLGGLFLSLAFNEFAAAGYDSALLGTQKGVSLPPLLPKATPHHSAARRRLLFRHSLHAKASICHW
jgi:GNAT superfamily N-acetyltransferase